MIEMERLMSILFPAGGHELVGLSFSPGEQSVTAEEFCKEVRSAIAQVNSGQSPGMARFPEDLATVTIDEFLCGRGTGGQS